VRSARSTCSATTFARRALRERVERREGVRDRGRVGKARARFGEHACGRTIELGQRAQRVAPRDRQPRGQLADDRRVLCAQRREQVAVLGISRDARARGERAIDADVAEVEVQRADADLPQRGQHEADHFAIARDARLAEQLGADLHDLARRARPVRHRAQHAARVAKARHAGLVQQVRVDARDLRRRVGAHAEHATGERVDDLERLQLEVAAGAGEQRESRYSTKRRLHEAVAARREMVEQLAQRLDARRLVGRMSLDRLGQDPLTHTRIPCRRSVRARSTRAR
jgi:hypothetical protein